MVSTCNRHEPYEGCGHNSHAGVVLRFNEQQLKELEPLGVEYRLDVPGFVEKGATDRLCGLVLKRQVST